MKRSEFVDIVNAVIDEERKESAQVFLDILSSDKPSKDTMEAFLKELLFQSAEIAGRTAGKIIERAGVIQFDD